VSINVGKPGNDGKVVVYIRTKNGVTQAPVTTIRINGAPTKNLSGKVINGKLAYLDTIRVAGNQIKLDTIVIQKPLSFTVSRLNKGNVHPSKSFALQPANTSTVFLSRSPNSSFSLSHLADKLIIINGKIASEGDLKKLSAFDIDRMVLKTDQETKELYGEKAKNGVLFILTRGGKASELH
jgi:hypothetical protein